MLPEGSDEPGPWRTPPEWRDIYAAAGLTGDNWRYRYVILPIPSQSGKTEFLLNVAGHRLDDGPRVPVLYFGATEDMVKDLARDRIDKFLRSTPRLWERTAQGQAYAVLQKWINGIAFAFGWAGSASQLASRPSGLVLLDEIDRMPLDVGREGSPFEMADARTKRYSLAKVIAVSSPTLWGSSPIWMRFEGGTMHMWTWQCPACALSFVPTLTHLHWTPGADPDEAQAGAHVRCPRCENEIHDADKRALNESGRYVRHRLLEPDERIEFPVLGRYTVDEDPQPRLTFSAWFSGLVPRFTPFGMLAYKLATAEKTGDPSVVQSVVNTWAGEPYEERGEAPASEEVMRCVADYAPRAIPEGVQLITAGIDVQRNSLFYAARGWGYNAESWLLDYGILAGDTAFDTVWMQLGNWLARGIGTRKIDMALIDSGYRPQFDDRPRPDHIVYSFCRRHAGPGEVYPAKGYDARDVPVTPRLIDYTFGGVLVRGGVRLFLIDTGAIKRWLHARIRWPEGQPGGWHLHRETTTKYADHLLAEEEVRKANGKIAWTRIRRENHWLDCEVNARAAALFLRVDDLPAPAPPTTESPTPPDFRPPPERYRRSALF